MLGLYKIRKEITPLNFTKNLTDNFVLINGFYNFWEHQKSTKNFHGEMVFDEVETSSKKPTKNRMGFVG